jgi:hypothetical protein
LAGFQFDPDRVAHLEAAGWRAYYEHAWPRFLWLIARLSHEQFGIPLLASIQAAYYITRAAAAWVAVDHDVAAVRRLHERYYQIARRYSGLSFDPARAAVLEEQYWDVHRRLSGKPDKTEFINTMIDLHALLFEITPEQARESAELRVQANNTVDLITSNTSTNPEADWAKLEDLLRQCYRSIQKARAARPAVA